MWDVLADLLLGSTCVRADVRVVRCAGPAAPRFRGPAGRVADAAHRGLALPMAAGEYDGVLKALVNAHKEHQALALARPLGEVLATVLRDLRLEAGPGPPVALVPVPSGRSRFAGAVTTRCSAAPGSPPPGSAHRRRARVAGRLSVPSRGADQAGLTAGERASNLAGALPAGQPRAVPDRRSSWSTTC